MVISQRGLPVSVSERCFSPDASTLITSFDVSRHYLLRLNNAEIYPKSYFFYYRKGTDTAFVIESWEALQMRTSERGLPVSVSEWCLNPDAYTLKTLR